MERHARSDRQCMFVATFDENALLATQFKLLENNYDCNIGPVLVNPLNPTIFMEWTQCMGICTDRAARIYT